MIKNLSFVRCSARALGFKGLIALEILRSHNLHVANVYIQDTEGYGLSLSDLYGSSVISNVTISIVTLQPMLEVVTLNTTVQIHTYHKKMQQ